MIDTLVTRCRAALARTVGAARANPVLAVLLCIGVALTGIALFRAADGTRVLANVSAEVRIRRFRSEIQAAAVEFELDPYVVAGMVFAESSGRPWVRSSANALGLMQLKRSTAAEQARKLGLPEPSEKQLLDRPSLNLRLGAAYFSSLLKRQKGDVRQALMAYNTGPTRFNRWLREAGGFERWLEHVEREQGPPKPGSVRHYAERVLGQAETYRETGLLE